MNQNLRCRRCKKMTQRSELALVQRKHYIELVCPFCSSKNFDVVINRDMSRRVN